MLPHDRGVSQLDCQDEEYVRAFDLKEWAPGTERTLVGHIYRQRIAAVCSAVVRGAVGPRVVDLGCAQGNIALELAAIGFEVTAVERNPAFLDYARSKDVGGQVTWMCAEIQEMPDLNCYDVAVLAEVIEHTGAPESLLKAVAALMREGGLLVITTPNGERLRSQLPTFSDWARHHPDRALIQFGPAGEHHQFLFTQAELGLLLSPSFEDLHCQPVSSIVWNRHTEFLLRLPGGRALLNRLEGFALALPPVSHRIANQWLVTARKR